MATTKVVSNLVIACSGTIYGDGGVAGATQQPKGEFRYDSQRNDLLKTYEAKLTVTTSGTEIDLYGDATMLDLNNVALSFAKVTKILIKSLDPANSGKSIVMGGAASNAFAGPFADKTDKLTIRAGGGFAIDVPDTDGYPVTAGTDDKLKIASGHASLSANLQILIEGY